MKMGQISFLTEVYGARLCMKSNFIIVWDVINLYSRKLSAMSFHVPLKLGIAGGYELLLTS